MGLEDLYSQELYPGLFTDVALWRPYVISACARNGLPAGEVRGGVPGTFPTFVVNNRLVVKFFGPLFDGATCYAIEHGIVSLLQAKPLLPVAGLLADGALFEGSKRWQWPYLIFEYLDGIRIGQVWGELDESEKMRLAGKLGIWVRALHRLRLPDEILRYAGRDDFGRFIAVQREGCAARQAAWGSLPAHLVAQIDEFLPSQAALVESSLASCLIHGDLTADHLIGHLEGGRWRTLGLIDFGDARLGNLYYELVALHLDLFQGDRQCLAAFLRSYGLIPREDFPRLALSYCLLHQFDVFAAAFDRSPLLRGAKTLEDLAEGLWRL